MGAGITLATPPRTAPALAAPTNCAERSVKVNEDADSGVGGGAMAGGAMDRP